MSVSVIEKNVLSCDGKHYLHGVVYLPENKPKALLHVVHGMTEYIGRYDAFMKKMAENGYLVFGYDHLGHGKTATKNELGYIADKNGWRLLAKDVASFSDAVRGEYGRDLPYYLLGHSMGSFIVRLAALLDVKPDKLIVMGTAGPNPVAGLGVFLSKVVALFCGKKHVSPFIESLAFGTYNKNFKEENDLRSWLTKDAAIREKYASDPLCNYHFSVCALGDLIELNRRVNLGSWFKGIDDQMPILLVSGALDPVGSDSKGVKTVYEKLKKNKKNVQIKLYSECRHEILNDTCKDEVIKDILDFLN